MSAKKKLSVGAWITCCAAVLAVVSAIVYAVNIGAEGYFQKATVNNLMLWVLGAAAMLVCAIIIKLPGLKGIAGSLAELVSGALRIGAPVLLALGLINLIAGRAEGLGFIYFSNADVAKEVQTAANLSSATGAIASMVLLGVAMLVAIVAAFFSIRKKA